jgi:signal transduction histidine kinase
LCAGQKTTPQKDRLDLSEMIAEVIAMVMTEIRANRVLLQTKLAPDLPLVTGDKIQLQQVVLNLLVNAIEALSGSEAERRELIVGSERVSNPESKLSEDGLESQTRTGTEPSYVLFSVRDSGSGLDPEHLDHLSKAFYTTKSQGLGMGLAISHSIIQAHGGRLWAKPNSRQVFPPSSERNIALSSVPAYTTPLSFARSTALTAIAVMFSEPIPSPTGFQVTPASLLRNKPLPDVPQ